MAFGLEIYGTRIVDTTPQKSGSEFTVNSHSSDIQADPDVSPLGTGFVVTWRSNLQDGDSYGSYFQRYNSSGIKLGSETRANTYTTNSQTDPKVAELDNGDFVIVWTSLNQDGDNWGVYGKRFNSSGSAYGSGDTLINTYTTSYQTNQDIAPLDDGGFVVVWGSMSQDGDSGGIYFQRYDSSFTTQGSETRANTTTSGSQWYPAISQLGTGFVIGWQKGNDLYAQIFNSSGSKVGSEFTVTTTGTASDLKIAELSTGDFIVTWDQTTVTDGDSYGIFAQKFNSSGTKVGSEFQVNTYITSTQWKPNIAATSSGYIIVWSSYLQDGNAYGVFGQVFSNDGGYVGNEFQINTNTIADQKVPKVAVLSSGNFVVAYYNTWPSPEIYAQMFTPTVANPREILRFSTDKIAWNQIAYIDSPAGNSQTYTYSNLGDFTEIKTLQVMQTDAFSNVGATDQRARCATVSESVNTATTPHSGSVTVSGGNTPTFILVLCR